MGVLSCDRSNCGNVMCHRYSRTYGYICDECYEELRVTLLNNSMTIDEFMSEPKKEFAKDECNAVNVEIMLEEEFRIG